MSFQLYKPYELIEHHRCTMFVEKNKPNKNSSVGAILVSAFKKTDSEFQK